MPKGYQADLAMPSSLHVIEGRNSFSNAKHSNCEIGASMSISRSEPDVLRAYP